MTHVYDPYAAGFEQSPNNESTGRPEFVHGAIERAFEGSVKETFGVLII